MPTTTSDSSRGDDATTTTTLSREHLKTLSGVDLRKRCRERGLETSGRRGVLVNRLLKDQKKAPKSNAARKAAHRAKRSEGKKEEDKASHAARMAASRANRSPQKIKEDKAKDLDRKQAKRADETFRLEENESDARRKAKWRQTKENRDKENARNKERRRRNRAEINEMALRRLPTEDTPVWKRPLIDYHLDHEHHPFSAQLMVYHRAGLGFDCELRWENAFISRCSIG